MSLRRSLIIPALLVIALWAYGANLFLGEEYHAGGVVHFEDQAVAIAERGCGDSFREQFREDLKSFPPMRAQVYGDTWWVRSAFKEHFWLWPSAFVSAKVDAQTGKIEECRVGLAN